MQAVIHKELRETVKKGKERKLTLHSVRETISGKTLENPAWKGLIYFFRDLLVFGCILTAIASTDRIYFLIPLWILAGFSISSLFIIGHDAAHGALFKSKRLAWWIGQTALLPSLHAYEQWSYGHNRIHHGHTIKLEGDFVWRPLSPAQYADLSFGKKILHRLYWSFLGAGPYYLIDIWLKGMVLFTAPSRGARRDKVLMLFFALASSAALVYAGGQSKAGFDTLSGIWFWSKMALFPFLAFNYFIGFSVYVHHIGETISWKKQSDWTPFHGQMNGTINYHVPAPVNFFMHNIFIHMPHHVNMRIPFYNLPRALSEIKAEYGEYVIERKSMFRDYLTATGKCKLFDPETGKWLKYSKTKSMELRVLKPDQV